MPEITLGCVFLGGIYAGNSDLGEGKMKALTISQPYAGYIAAGDKWIENRKWYTSHRGFLAIHAGKGTQYLSRDQLASFHVGSVVAIVKLTACVKLDLAQAKSADPATANQLVPGTNRRWSDVVNHKHAEGPWCWILEEVRKVGPISVRGAQGLWEWDGEPQAATTKR